jgi:hypothetical protein
MAAQQRTLRHFGCGPILLKKAPLAAQFDE